VPLDEVDVTPLHLERYRSVLTPEGRDEFERAIARGQEMLRGRVVWSVNSTARGGGVAEMLRSLIGYVRAAQIDARWAVIGGEPDFFALTKRIHNRLHGSEGDGGPLGADEHALFERVATANADALEQQLSDGDVVLLHDPQTAGMVPALKERGLPVVWRAHIGLDLPNDLSREAWDFLRGYVEAADAIVFSREAFEWEGLDHDHVAIIPPSIDAFSPKNQKLGFTDIVAILRAAGLAAGEGQGAPPAFERLDGSTAVVRRRAKVTEAQPLLLDTPLVTQVSRWDRLKDPLGVLEGFAEHVAPSTGAHLALVGPDVAAVADDPEGAEVLAEVQHAWTRLSTEVRRRVHLVGLPLDDADENAAIVNALQRRSDVVVQKSIAEGFGLTVSEAMWKGRPVVAGRVGGIQDQIEDGETGYLVEPHDLDAFGRRVAELLEDPPTAERIGAAAQARVRDHFLGPRHLEQWTDLLERVLAN
jgi:trehalose synthase